MSLATLIVDVEKGIEVGASDVLKWLADGGKVISKVAAAEPQALAALGVLLSAVETAVTSAGAAATGGLSVSLDGAAVTAIQAVWPDIKSLALTLGIKI